MMWRTGTGMPVLHSFVKASTTMSPGSQKDSFNTSTHSLIAACALEKFRICLLSGGEFSFYVNDSGSFHEKSSISNDYEYIIYT